MCPCFKIELEVLRRFVTLRNKICEHTLCFVVRLRRWADVDACVTCTCSNGHRVYLSDRACVCILRFCSVLSTQSGILAAKIRRHQFSATARDRHIRSVNRKMLLLKYRSRQIGPIDGRAHNLSRRFLYGECLMSSTYRSVSQRIFMSCFQCINLAPISLRRFLPHFISLRFPFGNNAWN